MLTAEEARRVWKYNAETGEFFWRISPSKKVKAGDVAGSRQGEGYWRVKAQGKAYLAHRVAWLIVFGRWPVDEIDHVNGNRADNRLVNLREATSAQNKYNKELGVGARLDGGKWQASIRVSGRWRGLGRYRSKEDATNAYRKAAKELRGQYFRTT
jgi:hypothetical protein